MTSFAFAARPSRGTKGEPYLVQTNCFKLSKIKPDAQIAFHHYQVISDIAKNREIKNVVVRRDIVNKLYVRDRPEVFQPGQTVYDGKAALFASKDVGQNINFEINRFYDASPQAEPNVRIMLRKVGYISSSDFDNLLLQGQGQVPPSHVHVNTITTQQVVNLMLQNATPPDFRRVVTPTSMFSAARRRELGSGLEVWLGCFANVRLAKDHLLLNVDVSAAVMHMSGRLPNVAMNILGLMDIRDVANPAHLTFLESRLRRLRVRQVEAGRIGRNRSVKKLISNAGHYKFPIQDGTIITVREYYLRTYNYRLMYPDLPGIYIEKKKDGKPSEQKDVIPFELLELSEGQFYKRALDTTVQSIVQRLTTTSPEERRAKIAQFLQYFSPQVLALSGLHLRNDFLQIRGRIMPPPSIQLGNKTILPEKGEWKMSSRSFTHFFRPCVINSWSVISYELAADEKFCMTLLDNMMTHMGGFGVNTQQLAQRRVTLRENPQGAIKEHFESLISRLSNLAQMPMTDEAKKHHLVLVILPGSGRGGLHEQIKRISDTSAGPGMITQLLAWDKLKGLKSPYLSNVALKINERMGGTNFVPVGEGMESVTRDPTMVIGLDVSHPSPGIIRPSMTGMVYSVDPNASTYFAQCSPQAPRLEFVENLKAMMIKALFTFAKRNGNLPKRLFVYRDGVSEGELDRVCPEEIKAIEAAIEEAWSGAPPNHKKYKILITFIVVGKRHHIRFFPGKGQGDRSGNCPSGFIADSDQIASPRMFDYFLQSHAGLLGTSRPAHYMVVRDDCNETADRLQNLSFNLCHTFSRATRAVSIPAPVYYAHLVCKRSNIHIEYKYDGPVPSMDGSNTPEFNPKDWIFFDILPLHRQLKYFI